MRFTFPSGLRFRFRLVPFIAMLVVVGIGSALGQWQLRRADQKQAIAVKLQERARAPAVPIEALGAAGSDPAALEFRRLRLRGRFIAGWPLYLDNRPYQGRAGLYVLMPLRLEGSGQVVLVERGWRARDARDRAYLAPLMTPAGTVEIEGRLRGAPGRVMQLGPEPPLRPNAIVENLDLVSLARVSGLPLQPYLVEQTSDTPDQLVRDWPQPSAGIERHLGYAFQWYALAALACVFFVVTGFRRGKPANP